mgnify:FL=1
MNKIIDEQTARDILTKLPLLFWLIPRNEYDIMLNRLYGEGNGWQPYKLVAKKFSISPKDIGLIEDKTLKLINQEVAKIFSCGNCGRDLRKSGITIENTGIQRSNGFIGDNGYITRENNHAFYAKNYKDHRGQKITCQRCSHAISGDSPVLLFINDSVNKNTILGYLEKIGKNIKEIPLVKKNKGKSSPFDEQYPPDFPNDLYANWNSVPPQSTSGQPNRPATLTQEAVEQMLSSAEESSF